MVNKKFILLICFALVMLFSLVACNIGDTTLSDSVSTNTEKTDSSIDTGVDSSIDSSADSSIDSSTDTGVDSSIDSSTDSSVDLPTNNPDEEPKEEEQGYFVATIEQNINVVASPYTDNATVPDELKGLYYSSDTPGGRPKDDGTGKIWLVLKPLKDAYVKRLVIDGEYFSVEELGRDLYCITGVRSDLTVSTEIDIVSPVQEEIFEDYGYGISDSGELTLTWAEEADNPIRYVQVSYTDKSGSHVKYIDAEQGSDNLFYMTENVLYTVSIRAVVQDCIGKKIDIKCCYMKAPKDVKFPRVEITTENLIWPECDFVESPEGCWGAGITNAFYEQCKVTLYNESNQIVYSSEEESGGEEFLGAKLKIRGNTSAKYASGSRFPYKLKLDKKYDLLSPLIGRSDAKEGYSDKDWLLLNYGNDGYRICGDAIADAVGTEWSPDYCYVTLYLNGEYRGLYVLSEAVEEGNGTAEEQWRVAVDEDGFVFECDAYWWNEDLYFSTPLTEKTPMYFTFKYPDSDKINESSPEYKYLRDYIIAFEEALKKNDDSYLEYIDLDSFVKWLLVADYLSIKDGGGCNIFLYKKDSTDGTRLCMGPNWDFDSYMGSVDGLATIRLKWNGAPFYYQYLIEKPSFQKRYKELFNETYNSLGSFVDHAFAQIDEEAHSQLLKYDNARFGTSTKSLSTRKQGFLNWLDPHLAWMQTQFK